MDSLPKRCPPCRRDLGSVQALRKEYDRSVARVLEYGDLESWQGLADVIDQLYGTEGDLPARINENRRRLTKQIASAEAEGPCSR